MKQFYFLISICLLTPLLALAQSNYREGYILKNSGDTVKGFINYRDWPQSPKSVEFKEITTNSPSQIFSAGSIKGFGIWGYKSYISYTGPVTLSKINTLMNLSHTLDTAARQDSAFLRVISRGPNVTLLYHNDDIKYRYFILENRTNTIAELKYFQYIENSDNIVSKPVFLSQLDQLSLKYTGKSIYSNSSNPQSAYYEDVILKYVKMINNNISIEEKRESHLRFFAGLSAKYNSSVFNDGPAVFNFETHSTSVSPMLSFGIDMTANPNIQKGYFRIEADFYSETSQFNGTIGYFSVKRMPVAITPQYIFNFSSTKNVKFFMGVGVEAIYCLTSDNKLVATQSGVILSPNLVQNKGDSYRSLNQGDYIGNPYDIGKLAFNLHIKAGVTINNKVELYATFIPVGTGGGSDYDYRNVGGAIGLNYLFRNK